MNRPVSHESFVIVGNFHCFNLTELWGCGPPSENQRLDYRLSRLFINQLFVLERNIIFLNCARFHIGTRHFFHFATCDQLSSALGLSLVSGGI